jgi:hypothetical protein
MKSRKYRILLLMLILSSGFLIQSCALLNRSENDIYKVTLKDSLYVYNSPDKNEMDAKGVLAPIQSREVHSRSEISYDSVESRHYPAFIRAGLFESIGLINGSSNGIGSGLFGVYPELKKLSLTYRGEKGKIFGGGIYRLGILEYRLRWFEDSPNWTIGTMGAEFILPNSKAEDMLMSYFPIYLKKRYFLKETLPYVCISASGGIGIYPSNYVNLSGSLDVGSYGGLNLRAYLGIVMGYNSINTPQILNNDFVSTAQTIVAPYFGLGVGVFDFLNTLKDYETEWKNQKHSAWNVGLISFGVNMFNGKDSNAIFSGYSLEIAKSHIIVPFADNRFTAGTSLISLVSLKESKQIFAGLLPIEISYWKPLIANSLIARPFVKLNYYPSTVAEMGLAIQIRLNEMFTMNAKLEYAVGTTGDFGADLSPLGYNSDKTVSSLIFNFSIGFSDRIMLPDEIRFTKK